MSTFAQATGRARTAALAAFAVSLPWGWWIWSVGGPMPDILSGFAVPVLLFVPGIALAIFPGWPELSRHLDTRRGLGAGRLVSTWACYGAFAGWLARLVLSSSGAGPT